VSEATGTRWIPVIGLEVHAQLSTQTKLFCSCEVRFGEPENSRTCPVCTGQPGPLPVLNRSAVELAVRAALALGCDVAPFSKFDRKNYFYCDLPKGYQISQFDQPYCTGGGLTLENGRLIRLHRIHMEEDAGKAIHDRGDVSLVDLNRAGVPLIESVTEADLTDADEAVEYLTALKEILQYVGASGCDMEKGELRCDVNVSVHLEGEPWRTKVEIKNLNSFRFVGESIRHEIARQIEAYESGDEARYPVQETRLYDPDRGVTRTMRVKESEDDYRYFAEPDLPPITVDAAYLDRQRGFVPELPAARRARYVSSLGLSAYDAQVLCSSRFVSDFFEATLRVSNRAKETANWINNELSAALSDAEVPANSMDELMLRPHELAELIELVADDKINHNAGKKVLRAMLQTGKDAKALVKELGLEQVTDTGEIEGWCKQALEGRDSVADDVRAGNEKAIGALIGPVMQASRGKADPKLVRETLLRIIREEG
jgi:aspartyl-tRNA(Asn)/glutamyl-tRNA(Gln) amidotransferase subunit B